MDPAKTTYFVMGYSETELPDLEDSSVQIKRLITEKAGPQRAAIKGYRQVLKDLGEKTGVVLIETPFRTRSPVHLYSLNVPFGERLKSGHFKRCDPTPIHYNWAHAVQAALSFNDLQSAVSAPAEPETPQEVQSNKKETTPHKPESFAEYLIKRRRESTKN